MTEETVSGRELEPAFSQGMPEPHTLTGIMRDRLNAMVLELREQRGDVHAPEDVFVPVRQLHALAEGLAGYAQVFRTIGKEVLGHVEDELVEAVGEQDGVPLSGLTVPDEDGTDIRVDLDTGSKYTFDLDAIVKGVVVHALATHPFATSAEAAGSYLLSTAKLATLLEDVVRKLLEAGKFEPQVTKVKTLAAEIARTDPKAASAITTTIKRRKEFRGVKTRRDTPK